MVHMYIATSPYERVNLSRTVRSYTTLSHDVLLGQSQTQVLPCALAETINDMYLLDSFAATFFSRTCPDLDEKIKVLGLDASPLVKLRLSVLEMMQTMAARGFFGTASALESSLCLPLVLIMDGRTDEAGVSGSRYQLETERDCSEAECKAQACFTMLHVTNIRLDYRLSKLLHGWHFLAEMDARRMGFREEAVRGRGGGGGGGGLGGEEGHGWREKWKATVHHVIASSSEAAKSTLLHEKLLPWLAPDAHKNGVTLPGGGRVTGTEDGAEALFMELFRCLFDPDGLVAKGVADTIVMKAAAAAHNLEAIAGDMDNMGAAALTSGKAALTGVARGASQLARDPTKARAMVMSGAKGAMEAGQASLAASKHAAAEAAAICGAESRHLQSQVKSVTKSAKAAMLKVVPGMGDGDGDDGRPESAASLDLDSLSPAPLRTLW